MRSLVVSLDVFGAMIYYFYDPNFVSIEVGARRSVTSPISWFGGSLGGVELGLAMDGCVNVFRSWISIDCVVFRYTK